MSTAVPSPTSSVIDLRLDNNALIIRDAEDNDPDVAEDEEQVGGIFTGSSEDSEERKKALREQLRRTLNSKDSSTLRRLSMSSLNRVIYHLTQTLLHLSERVFPNLLSWTKPLKF